MKIGNGKDVHGGATVWTTAKDPELGWQLRRWTVSAGEDAKQVRLEPSGRGGAVIFMAAELVFATAAEARDYRVGMLEGELAQVRGLAV